MRIDDIFWHDSLILKVTINPERDLVEMRLLLPEEARQKTYAEQTIVFQNAYGYKEFEGPFQGCPTILSVAVIEQVGQWSKLKIETNAGYRELFCCDVFQK
ncbi:MAG: hypothetical protein BWY57_02691 [Betaproteobacteria bacterium ADurb.Bin341]|nr:MAG: hypothetical protein BWY57_02691 [Betaproteobacteria bacterium ADurb.Bin341]